MHQRVLDDLQTPDCYFIFPSRVYVFDHEKKCAFVILWGENKASLEKGLSEIDSFFQDAEKEITPDFSQALSKYNVNRTPRPRSSSLKEVVQKVLHKAFSRVSFFGPSHELKSNLSRDQYISKVEGIREYIRAGETYQVNFSQRFSFPFSDDSFRIFERLTSLNPSPFQAYFQCPKISIASCSPERLVSVQPAHLDGSFFDGVFFDGRSFDRSFFEKRFFDGHSFAQDSNFLKDLKHSEWVVETRPIKGTISRGKTQEEDEKNQKALLESVKDNAELSMIVDLARNDLGRVCRVGTIEVNEHRVLEGYSHVWHTVSNIRGVLERGKDFSHVIRAVFPGGSITGCPKKRTMEIIDEMEDFKRGVYTGSAGYIGFDGAMDLNIMIRTLVHTSGKVYFHSGGGIVFDSDPEKEYQETLDKAAALKESILY
ncbi:anthranilate synthase component I family protein [Candidatus Peregrinibacteria bacterium]|nr:anthranilate synthase component I family protein [Candidatus Peregrinibacteria bacterium]